MNEQLFDAKQEACEFYRSQCDKILERLMQVVETADETSDERFQEGIQDLQHVWGLLLKTSEEVRLMALGLD